MRKFLHRLICIYFSISCLLMAIGFIVIVTDCVNVAITGEFRLLPSLNPLRFKVGTTIEEDYKFFSESSDLREQLEIAVNRSNDLLWCFINISTTLALANLLLYYSMHLFNIRFSRWTSVMVIATGGIALLLITASRIYAHNSWGYISFMLSFPIAFNILKTFLLPILVLSILTGIKIAIKK